MTHGSLFSGIGGFDLAAEWMGWENKFHCEWNPFGQRVLKYYWPNAKSYEDITKTDFTIHRGSIDILTGGFPCQPYSMAGKRKGKEDERHLWPEMLRAIREIGPSYIVGENVLGLVNWDGGLVFDEVQADLESAGYEVQAVVIPAAAVNAPHGRDRVWFVAYNNGIIRGEGDKLKSREQSRYGKSNEKSNTTFNRNATDTNSGRLERAIEVGWNSEHVERKSEFGFTADADNTRNTTSRCEIERNRTEESEEREYSQPEFNGHGFDGLTADAESQSSERLRPEQRKFSQSQQRKFGRNGGKMGYGLTADTDSDGQHERNSNDEINPSEGRINAQCYTNTSNVDGNATYADSRGLEGSIEVGWNGNNVIGKSKFGTATDTDSAGISRQPVNTTTSERPRQRGQSFKKAGNFGHIGTWDNFPTQSPVCGRNDGLSRELDGITFSKWRNESIKAYGNAIVPQVAYEIFKVIQIIETQSQPC